MCVILACKSKKPSETIIQKCYADNDDGAGIAWFENKKGENGENLLNAEGKELFIAKYKKGLDLSGVTEMVNKLELPFVIHFRACSVGGKSPLLTHPFEMTPTSTLRLEGECDRLLVHNGTFSDWRICLAARGLTDPLTEAMSDTRAISMIASDFNDSFVKKINKGKFIIIDAKMRKFRLIGETFIEKDGIIFSNLSWENKVVHTAAAKTYNQSESSVSTPVTSCDLPDNAWDAIQDKIAQKKKPSGGIIIANILKDGKLVPTVVSDRGDAKTLKALMPLTRNSTPEERLLRLQFFTYENDWSFSERKRAFRKFCRRNNIVEDNWRTWCGKKDKRDSKYVTVSSNDKVNLIGPVVTDGLPLVSGFRVH